METRQKLLNPYRSIDISLIIPSVEFAFFNNLHSLLTAGSSSPGKVELLVKIDNVCEIERYYQLCESSEFMYKILVYPKYHSRHSLHHFFNDLARLSSGKILWVLNDDITAIRGNWQETLMSTRNQFKDNIYCVKIPLDNGKGTDQIIATPAVSKEWVDKFGYLTAFPNYDRWLCEMSQKLGRQIIIKNEVMGINMPQGKRVLSKQERKEIFYSKFEEELKMARHRL